MSVQQIDYDALAAALARRGIPGLTSTEDRKEVVEEAVVGGCAPSGESVGVESVGSEFELTGVGVESEGSLSGGEPGEVGELVRSTVKFGGMADVGDHSPAGTKGFYASVVKRVEVSQLRAKLEGLMGAKLPKAAMQDLAVCTYTAGTMPSLVSRGKDRLRMLALVGDSALRLHLHVHSLRVGRSPEATNTLQTASVCGPNQCDVMVRQGWIDFVHYPPGVNPHTCKATATCLEAIIGVVALWRDAFVVNQLLRSLQFY